jgi:hypothetical protein
MMPLKIIVAASLLYCGLLLSGCQSNPETSADEKAIQAKMENLFMRLKANDKAVMWENELPYLHDEMDWETYQTHPAVAFFSADSLIAIQIDSVTVFGDSAHIHMHTEYRRKWGNLSGEEVALPYYKYDGHWYKTMVSELPRQYEYDEELRMYREAIQEKEKDKAAKADQPQGEG